jgi:hypothetical protein
MNKIAVITGLGAAVLTGAWSCGMLGTTPPRIRRAGRAAADGGEGGRARPDGRVAVVSEAGRGGGRGQLTVELARGVRARRSTRNWPSWATWSATQPCRWSQDRRPLEEISVQLGDRVSRGQRIAKIEDQEILEQVKQAEAAFQVASATIRQREADLALAKDQCRAIAQPLPAAAAAPADAGRF